MDTELTKDSEYLLCTLYAKYKEQIQNGVPKRTAKCFGSSKDIFNSIFAEWNYEDVDETCCELMRVGFLNCIFGDGVVYDSELTDKAIIYMENRFECNLNRVMDYIVKVKSLIF